MLGTNLCFEIDNKTSVFGAWNKSKEQFRIDCAKTFEQPVDLKPFKLYCSCCANNGNEISHLLLLLQIFRSFASTNTWPMQRKSRRRLKQQPLSLEHRNNKEKTSSGKNNIISTDPLVEKYSDSHTCVFWHSKCASVSFFEGFLTCQGSHFYMFRFWGKFPILTIRGAELKSYCVQST